MSEIKDGGPAFPCKASINRNSGELQPHQFGNDDFVILGMTLRDYFAAKVLHALIVDAPDEGCSASDDETVERERTEFADNICRDAYRYADAMIRARGAT